jgi:hypothetical protein
MILLIMSVMLNCISYAQLFVQPGMASPVFFPAADKRADVFSVTINPALASIKEKYSLGIYGEKPLLIRDFNAIALALLVPVKTARVFAVLNRAGIEHYNVSMIRFGLSRELGIARIGIGGSYRSVNLKGYGRTSNISLEVGANVTLTQEVMALFHINGISSGSKDAIEDLQAMTLCGGMIYTVSDEVAIGMNWTKTRGSPGYVHLNTKYFPATTISINIGYLSNINCIYVGASYRRGKFLIGFTARYQQVFGFIPTTMIGYDQQ